MKTWTSLRDAAAELAAALDPSLLPVDAAERLVAVLTATENIVAAARAQVAARAAESDRWRGPDSKTPAHELARRTGLPLGRARDVLDTGRRLADQQRLREAAASGDLSFDAVAAISDAAAAAPGAAERLIDTARRSSYAELRDECHATKANADPDREATRRRIHAARRLRQRTERDGTAVTTIRGLPEDAAEIRALIHGARENLFRDARAAGRREPSDALDYDALLATLRRGAGADEGTCRAETAGTATTTRATPTTGPARASRAAAAAARRWRWAKVIVRVDQRVLAGPSKRDDAPGPDDSGRITPESGGTCEVVGSGPITPGTVGEMVDGGASVAVVETRPDGLVTRVAHLGRRAGVDLADPDAATAALERNGVEVAGVVSARRRPGAHVTTALEWMYPTCAVDGCHRTRRLEMNHEQPWAATRRTVLDDLDRLCDDHHDLHTNHGWRLVPGVGKRAFVPPTDARHPANRHTRTGPAP